MQFLILRSEVVCMAVLLFLITINLAYREKDSDTSFLRVLCVALVHVVFDFITVYTVNNMDIVSPQINKSCHIIFYYSGIWISMEIFNYIVKLTMPISSFKTFRIIGFIPYIVFVILAFILPIEYVHGNGTYYSYGPLVFAGYGIFAVYCLASSSMVLFNIRKIDLRIRVSLLPTLAFMAILVLVQALIPETLMTGAGITVVCVGMYATINNPIRVAVEQASWDKATGLRSKNAFIKQIAQLCKKYTKKQIEIGFVVVDLNGLKNINDNFGHSEGDTCIKTAASILLNNLKSSYGIYRTGGDEFVAVYLSPKKSVVESEINSAISESAVRSRPNVPVSFAVGYSEGRFDEAYMDIFSRADELMYLNKQEMKEKNPELCSR